ncbi:hypothetical protein CDAR_528821 [Caerostris darwini]|uniref:Uncharacterized protein n=1 Tax=Caerostris darwini TaxID=1538125 RepID=A0AAV4UP51_9ARAC|nr:hypothetical protein CDAR_528821 [Caerostris darwini]
MADGRKTIVLVTDQETGRQGVVRDHHPLPVSGRHVNPGASPVPCVDHSLLIPCTNPWLKQKNGQTQSETIVLVTDQETGGQGVVRVHANDKIGT